MSQRPRSSSATGAYQGSGRTVTLDQLSAGGHPDAVVNGVLLLVIALLVAVGLAGLVGPVLTLDLFRPDLGLGEALRTLARIVVSVAALVVAGLGMAKHPRFPRLFMAVAAGLTLLISLSLSLRLTAGPEAGAVGLFHLLGLLVIVTVPYVVFSRRCRLIFHRQLDLNDLKALAGPQDWSTAAVPADARAPVLPSSEGLRPAAAPRRQRARRASPAAESGAAEGAAAAAGPATPPVPGAANAALWAALYGTPAEAAANPAEGSPEDPTGAGGAEAGGQGAAGKRVGLESLINLRAPGT